MYRIIDESLLEWKRHPFRKPIFLQGAMRTGKTYAAVNFGQKAYDGNFIKVDCAEPTHAKRLFPQNQNLGGLLAEIEKIHATRVDFEKTLVIIDNAHLFPAVFRLVKDLYDQRKNLHFILIGKLTGETAKKFPFITSFYEHHRMYPLCFSEFLRASGRDNLAQLTLDVESVETVNFHEEIVHELQNYMLTGGMPEVVNTWLENKVLEKVRDKQKEIVSKILALKFPGLANQGDVKSIIQSVAYNAGYQMDYQTISSTIATSQIKHCLDCLKEEGIVYRVQPSTPYSIPDVNFKVKKFKAIFLDVGLLQIVSGIASKLDEEGASAFKMFEVALYDQFVGQELQMAQSTSVLYWASSVKESSARVNYLIPTNGNLTSIGVPIVIQHEDVAALNHSLDICLGAHPECSLAYILSMDAKNKNESSQDGKILKAPLYYAMNLGMGS